MPQDDTLPTPKSRPVEDLSRVIPVETVSSSEDRGWCGVEAKRFRYATEGFYLPGFAGHAVVVHLGPTAELVEREEGRLHKALVRKGDVSVVPAGLESEWWWEGKEVDRLHTYLDPDLLRAAAAEEGADLDGLEVINSVAARDPLLEQAGMALLNEMEAGGPAGRMYAESLASVLALHLLRRHSSFGRASREGRRECSGGLSETSLRAALDYVGDNLASDLSLAEIAAAANLSPYHFARAFKRSTGLAPHQYVVEQRIERAKALLANTGLSVGEVAARVGFSSPSHFARQFRRLVGVSPGSFR